MNTRFFFAAVVLIMVFGLPQLAEAQSDYKIEVDLDTEPQENYFCGGSFDNWHLAKQYLADWRQGSEEHLLNLHALLTAQDFLPEELGVTAEEKEILQTEVRQEAKRLLDALNAEPKNYARVVELQRFVAAHKLKANAVGGMDYNQLESMKFTLRRELLHDYAEKCRHGEIERLPILESGMADDRVISFQDLGISKKDISRLRYQHTVYLGKGYLKRWRAGDSQSLNRLVWLIHSQAQDQRPRFSDLGASKKEAKEIQALVDEEDEEWYNTVSEFGENEPNAQ